MTDHIVGFPEDFDSDLDEIERPDMEERFCPGYDGSCPGGLAGHSAQDMACFTDNRCPLNATKQLAMLFSEGPLSRKG